MKSTYRAISWQNNQICTCSNSMKVNHSNYIKLLNYYWYFYKKYFNQTTKICWNRPIYDKVIIA
jgi:hypothetical protein